MGAFFHLQAVGFNDNRISVGQVQDEKWPGKDEFFGDLVNLAGGCPIQ